MKLWVPLNSGSFLNRWGALSFRKWTLLRGIC